MHVVVTGATGLVGSALVPLLRRDGHAVTRFSRTASGEDVAHWDPAAGVLDTDALAAADAVVHLAGRSIGALRWTGGVKRDIRQSRTSGTRLLAETMAGLAKGPRVLVSSSGIHYYGDRGDEALTEASAPGEGFLAGVCRDWEAAADPAREAGLRVVHVRTGLVQASGGGALRTLARLFRLGLGGRLGPGRQWWSWVALDDLVGIMRHAVVDEGVEGPLNATAPNPVSNAEYTATLARLLGRPALAHVPRFAPRLAMGQMAEELLFCSIRALPEATSASGYTFRWPELGPALRHLLLRPS
ncbi:MAG TPA: TIGR01777 family oxidoreductase [Actinomycetes bacterium]